MRLWNELRRRRVFGFLGAYIAAGFLVLEGVDQAIGHGLLPVLAYRLVLVFYLFGIPGTSVLAWFHGEKGTQKPVATEIWLQALLLVAALGVSYAVVRDYQEAAAARAAMVSDASLNPRRIAVLYFDDLSSDGRLGYLADGLTVTLIGQLSQVRALGVVSRNGVEPYRGSALPEDSIARALEVGTLIAGSVEENRGRIRVTTRLVDGVSGADFQRDNFELPADAELELGDSLAQEVSRFLRERLGEEIRLRERRAATSSTEAWSLVQRAERLRKDALERADADLAGAFDTFEAADSIAGAAEVADPDWAEPVVLRGRIAYERVRLTEDAYDAVPWIEAGLGHAERGMEIERNYPEALALRGMLRYAHWELRVTEDPEEWRALLDGARQDLETAVNLDPTLAEAHVTLSYLYYQIDDVPAALLAARRAFEEDAYLSEANDVLWRLFWGSLDLEQFNQARRWCAEGTRRFPEDFRFSHCQLWLMATPATHAEVERAWELRESVEALAPEGRGDFARVQAHMLTAGAIARAGLVDSARAVLDAARARVTHDIDPTQDLLAVQAYVLTLIGDKDEAIDLLKQYKAANPDHGFEHTAGTVWWWRELRSHPRFREVTEP